MKYTKSELKKEFIKKKNIYIRDHIFPQGISEFDMENYFDDLYDNYLVPLGYESLVRNDKSIDFGKLYYFISHGGNAAINAYFNKYLDFKLKTYLIIEEQVKEVVSKLIENVISVHEDTSISNNIGNWQSAFPVERAVKAMHVLHNTGSVFADYISRNNSFSSSDIVNYLGSAKISPDGFNDSSSNVLRNQTLNIFNSLADNNGKLNGKTFQRFVTDGHNNFGVLHNLPENIVNLVKYLYITGCSRNLCIPSSDKVFAGCDYLIMVKDFNLSQVRADVDLLKQSLDFMAKRYLNKGTSEEYYSQIYFSLACYVALNYSLSTEKSIQLNISNNKMLDELKTKSYYSEIEKLTPYQLNILLTKFSVDEIDRLVIQQSSSGYNSIYDMLCYCIYFKNYIQLNEFSYSDDNYNRIDNMFAVVKNANDLSLLSGYFKEWINSIDLNSLSSDEFDKLFIIDSDFIYGQLDFSKKIVYKKCKKHGLKYRLYYTEQLIDDFLKFKMKLSEEISSSLEYIPLGFRFMHDSNFEKNLDTIMSRISNPDDFYAFFADKSNWLSTAVNYMNENNMTFHNDPFEEASAAIKFARSNKRLYFTSDGLSEFDEVCIEGIYRVKFDIADEDDVNFDVNEQMSQILNLYEPNEDMVMQPETLIFKNYIYLRRFCNDIPFGDYIFYKSSEDIESFIKVCTSNGISFLPEYCYFSLDYVMRRQPFLAEQIKAFRKRDNVDVLSRDMCELIKTGLDVFPESVFYKTKYMRINSEKKKDTASSLVAELDDIEVLDENDDKKYSI